jgi:hypothetical protein
MYFSGRDEHYRPILIVNSGKLTAQDEAAAVAAMDYLINYMVDILLIEGQIENYVLIVNLAAYTVDLRSVNHHSFSCFYDCSPSAAATIPVDSTCVICSAHLLFSVGIGIPSPAK